MPPLEPVSRPVFRMLKDMFCNQQKVPSLYCFETVFSLAPVGCVGETWRVVCLVPLGLSASVHFSFSAMDQICTVVCCMLVSFN